ncbi:uncharacterized protein LOC131158425 [Malania oleifera]|uniref:uncharacterized protein LOC131158425 n=1 Tax=Malania oleifera TaxID=397392 RepID=UPI0025AE2BF6|nr:uncharacterized protein LOC131158425 [Malania oleifera]
MARLTFAVAVIFFFFAVSHARTPFDFLENDAVGRQTQNAFPDPDAKPTILLPSENPDAVTADDAKPLQSAEDLPESETDLTDTVTSVPLTLINFRPINRRPMRPMPFRPFHPLRIGHRCRHHHFNPHMTRFPVFREVPYGDDMLTSGEEFEPVEYRGDNGQRIPARRVRFPHSRPAFPHPHHHHHHHHHDEDGAFGWGKFRRGPFRVVEREDRGREEEEGGFLNRIREIFNRF